MRISVVQFERFIPAMEAPCAVCSISDSTNSPVNHEGEDEVERLLNGGGERVPSLPLRLSLSKEPLCLRLGSSLSSSTGVCVRACVYLPTYLRVATAPYQGDVIAEISEKPSPERDISATTSRACKRERFDIALEKRLQTTGERRMLPPPGILAKNSTCFTVAFVCP